MSMRNWILVNCFICKVELKKKPVQVRRNKSGVFSCQTHHSEHAKLMGFGKLNKGKVASEETRKKMRESRKIRVGELAPCWKGEEAGYFAIHSWIRKQFGAAKNYPCMICAGTRGSKRIEWANLDGKYSRNPQTWTTMCKVCHANFDGIGLGRTRNKIGQYGKD